MEFLYQFYLHTDLGHIRYCRYVVYGLTGFGCCLRRAFGGRLSLSDLPYRYDKRRCRHNQADCAYYEACNCHPLIDNDYASSSSGSSMGTMQ